MKLSNLFTSLSLCLRLQSSCCVDVKRVSNNQIQITLNEDLLELFNEFIENHYPNDTRKDEIKQQISMSREAVSPEVSS